VQQQKRNRKERNEELPDFMKSPEIKAEHSLCKASQDLPKVLKWLKTCRLFLGQLADIRIGHVASAIDAFLSFAALQHHGAETCILT
jgi:hypothetical protein